MAYIWQLNWNYLTNLIVDLLPNTSSNLIRWFLFSPMKKANLLFICIRLKPTKHYSHLSKPNSTATSSMSLSWTHMAGEPPWQLTQICVMAFCTPLSLGGRQEPLKDKDLFLFIFISFIASIVPSPHQMHNCFLNKEKSQTLKNIFSLFFRKQKNAS